MKKSRIIKWTALTAVFVMALSTGASQIPASRLREISLLLNTLRSESVM